MMFITCKYSCPLCGIKDVHVEVPARGLEDVSVWMRESCMVALSADHQRRSPDCHPQILTDIYIPMTGTTKVGGPVTH